MAKASSTLTVTTESQCPYREREASAAISRLDQHPPPDPQCNSKHASGKRCTITSHESSLDHTSSPLSSPHETEHETEPQAQNSSLQSDGSEEGSEPEKELHFDGLEAEPEEELPPRCHIDKGKGIFLPDLADIDDHHDEDAGASQYYYDEEGGARQHNSDDNNGLYDDHDSGDHNGMFLLSLLDKISANSGLFIRW